MDPITSMQLMINELATKKNFSYFYFISLLEILASLVFHFNGSKVFDGWKLSLVRTR